jgi:hypothetical protein
MASKVVKASGKKTQAIVQTRVQQYDKGSSFIIEPIGGAATPKQQVVNKSYKNLAMLFEVDADGDHVLTNALSYIRDNDPQLFQRCKDNLITLITQVKEMH